MNQDNVSELSDISTHGQLFRQQVFVLEQHIVLAQWHNCPWVEMSLNSDTLSWFIANKSEFSDTTDSCFSELVLYVGLVQRIIGHESG
jgi:hypothetical protein